MNKEYDKSLSFKHVFESFKCWPQLFKFIWNDDKCYLVFISIFSVIQGFIPSLSIFATQNLINTIQLGSSNGNNYVIIPFLLYIIVTVISAVVLQTKNYFESIIQAKLLYKTNLSILEKAITFELKNVEDSNVYDMLKRAQSDTGNRPYIVFGQILNLVSQIITLLSTAALLIIWKWWVVLIILIIPVISSLYSIKLGDLQYNIQKERAQKQRKYWYIGYLLTNDICFKEIKLYGLSKYFFGKFNDLNKEFLSQDKTIIVKRTKINFIFAMLDQIIGALVLFLIIKSAYLGQILIGSTIAYIRCVSNVQTNTTALLSNLVNMYQNNLYINQFFEFINLPINNSDAKIGIDINEIKTIEFRNVSYRYKNRKEYAIRNLNLFLNKGDKVALVGHNGSGKTTLVKLLSGFYNDYEGEIFINSIELKKINLDKYRRNIGIVFQDYSKYELTLRENIGVGDIENIKNDKLLIESLKNSNGQDIFYSLEKGLENQLGVWFDGGVQLSGGQWQKLALSRAFLRKSSVYILDEPSSALDPVAEYEMLCKCNELIKSNIGIFITHRLFNIKKVANKIIVLNNGQIVEQGNHESLMEKRGCYEHLYHMQNAYDRV